MIVDSSALVAIVLKEPETALFSRMILGAPTRRCSAVSWLEAMMVSEGRMGPSGSRDMRLALAALEMEIVAFDPSQAELAYSAWLRYGKGRHPAALNLGDCCAYAAARALREPLLFKGRDFALTDIEAVVW
ncbi:MAG: type II toxin-antitoxin system VapC family toxin [Terriglobales bacterium]